MVSSQAAVPYRETPDVIYTDVHGVGLLMNVFAPVVSGGPGAGCGVVCVASGGWTSEPSMMDNYRTSGLFDALCARGYAVFAVRPGSQSAFTVEQMLENVKRGIRFVKSRASDYGIDPSRLGLLGVSAGGHLACLAATRAEPGDAEAEDPLQRLDTGVCAVVAFCPPTDFLDYGGRCFAPELMPWRAVFDDGPEPKSDAEKEAAVRALCPARQVKPGLPPFFLAHGDADDLVPLQQSETMANALREARVPVELVVNRGGVHSWEMVAAEIGRMADWFDARLACA